MVCRGLRTGKGRMSGVNLPGAGGRRQGERLCRGGPVEGLNATAAASATSQVGCDCEAGGEGKYAGAALQVQDAGGVPGPFGKRKTGSSYSRLGATSFPSNLMD